MKKTILLLLCFILVQTVFPQGNIGVGTNTPDASAVLDVSSTSVLTN
jgi:hypothetical protein